MLATKAGRARTADTKLFVHIAGGSRMIEASASTPQDGLPTSSSIFHQQKVWNEILSLVYSTCFHEAFAGEGQKFLPSQPGQLHQVVKRQEKCGLGSKRAAPSEPGRDIPPNRH